MVALTNRRRPKFRVNLTGVERQSKFVQIVVCYGLVPNFQLRPPLHFQTVGFSTPTNQFLSSAERVQEKVIVRYLRLPITRLVSEFVTATWNG